MLHGNIMKKIYIFPILIYLLVYSASLFSQHNETARITIRGGHSINFIFNSFEKYENGIYYEDWTQIEIYYIDTNDDGDLNADTRWKLLAKAEDANMQGVSNTLSLDYLYIAAECLDCNPVNDTEGTFRLTNADQTLIDDGEMTDKNVEISYYCGMKDNTSFTILPDNTAAPYNTLLGEEADYYTVNLFLTLTLDTW